MQMTRSIGWVTAIAWIFLILVPEAGAEKKIGIMMFSDIPRYRTAVKGLMDKLAEEGYREPHTRFIVEKADANKANAEALVKKFAEAKLDLIITAGTETTIPVAREIKDVPIVFTVVYDPVASGIAKSWKSSGNNTTGTSARVPMSMVLGALKEAAPVKRLAVLYTPGEKNSELQLKNLQEFRHHNSDLKIIPVPLTTAQEVLQILPEIIRASDAIYITGSNFIIRQLPRIVDMTTKARAITITHLMDLVESGVLLGVVIDIYSAGRFTGEKAVKILKGAKPASVPIDYPKKYDLVLNVKTMKAGAFQLSTDFLNKVDKKIN